MRDRLAALDTVTTAAALTAEGVTLSAAAEVEVSEAAAELAAAEETAARNGRSVGKWTPAGQNHLTGRDVMSLASQAAKAAARQIRAAGMPRLTDAELDDLKSDLALVALERGTDGTLPRWRDMDPERTAEAQAAARRWMAASYPRRIDAAETAVSRLAGSYRAAWLAFLTAHGRTYARQRVNEYRAAEAARDRQAEAAEAKATNAAEAASVAAALAERHALSDRQKTAVAGALDGLTHRDRAAITGRTVAAEKMAASRGRADLLERWPTAAALRETVLEAERAAREAEGPLSPEAAEAWSAYRAELQATALLRIAPEAPARTGKPRSARGLLLVTPYRLTGRVDRRTGMAALVSAAIDRAPNRTAALKRYEDPRVEAERKLAARQRDRAGQAARAAYYAEHPTTWTAAEADNVEAAALAAHDAAQVE